MTGAEQITVKEIRDSIADFRAEVRDELSAIRRDVRVLQDDMVARDAVERARHGSVTVSWKAVSFAFAVGATIAGLAMRLLGVG